MRTRIPTLENTQVRHPRLVMFLGCGYMVNKEGERSVFLVLEYCDKGTLEKFVDASKADDPPSFKTRVSLLSDIAEGMEYLHCVHNSVRGVRARVVRARVVLARVVRARSARISSYHPLENHSNTTILSPSRESLKHYHFITL